MRADRIQILLFSQSQFCQIRLFRADVSKNGMVLFDLSFLSRLHRIAVEEAASKLFYFVSLGEFRASVGENHLKIFLEFLF